MIKPVKNGFCNTFKFKFKSIIRKHHENKVETSALNGMFFHRMQIFFFFCSGYFSVHNEITVIAFALKAMDSTDA